MKKRKILFLLIATLCVTLLLAGCNGDGKGDDNGGNESGGAGFFDFFELAEDTKVLYTDVSEMEGQIEDFDEYENLIATKETDVNAIGKVKETLKVLNVMTGEVVYETTNEYDYSEEESHVDTTTYHLCLDYYPLIQLERRTLDWSEVYDSDIEDYVWESTERSVYDYYVAKAGTSSVVSGSKVSEAYVYEGDYGFYVCKVGSAAFVLDGDLNRIDGSLTSAMINLNDDNFYAYRDKHFYSLSFDCVVIYDENRVPVIEYYPTNDKLMIANLLNNGNVLVQTQKKLEKDATEYSTCTYGTKYLVESFVIDYKTGDITELELNYLLAEASPAFTMDDDDIIFGLKFTDKVENFGVALEFTKENAITIPRFAVFDNNAKILASIPCNAENVEFFGGFEFISEDRYIATVGIGHTYYSCLFNTKGEMIGTICEYDYYDVVNDHILVGSKLYDLDMKLVCDFEKDTSYNGIYAVADRIFLCKNGLLTDMTDEEEVYTYDFESGDIKLLADGVTTIFSADSHDPYFSANGAYSIMEYNYSSPMGGLKFTLYNAEDEVIFIYNMMESPQTVIFEECILVAYGEKIFLLK